MSSSAVKGSHGAGGRCKLTPHLDKRVTKKLNLTVLQRMDPFISEILMTVSFVTFYSFDVDATQWSRKDVEGTLFVVKRNTQPRFQFVVMNMRREENLVENLLHNFEFEVQLPYLFYRNAAQEVNGIWFYDSRECEEVANLITRILNAYSKVPPKPQVSSSKSEFEELEAVPTSSVIEGRPLEQSYIASTSSDPHNDSSFVNLSRAVHIGNESSKVKTPSLDHPPAFPPSSCVHGAGPCGPTLRAPSLTLSAPSADPVSSLHAASEQSESHDQVVNLVKPSSFFSPPSTSTFYTPATSSTPTAAIHLPLSIHLPLGSSTLQPFRPTPPATLTPDSVSVSNYGPLSRERVRDALLMLALIPRRINFYVSAALFT
ncbi:mRNA-decapping enzyme-like protein isoform X2 [Olea europaea var. sylvestris]|uniref:mRNA-decapping enzyme-like protein isoform X2 n=1 Tax=Olea europaea var. sylvestris TaxID=158386 RepID=UPI000C1D4DF9|nr:mRNA-decapping enzyme-like protein isoform X2 [Olea europaea var. sylvestris]XP_022882808.1 mRNA-decapping enzyme-like protein isoform X2 [Olea europaea var. sylvestris]